MLSLMYVMTPIILILLSKQAAGDQGGPCGRPGARGHRVGDPLVAVDCIALNYWGKHKRKMAIKTGKQPAAIEIHHWLHSTTTGLHYHYIG